MMRLVPFLFSLGAFASTRARKRVRVVDAVATPPVVEYFNYTAIELNHGAEFVLGLQTQLSEDVANQAFLPDIRSNGTQNTPLGILTLGRPLFSAHQSVIYTVEGDDTLLVKYQANCNEAEANDEDGSMLIHPLLLDHWFSRKASIDHVGPNVSYLSPPSPLCDTKEGKCAFRMSDLNFGICKSRPNVSLRYMLMERVPGINLFSFKQMFPNGVVSFPHALLIGYGLISKFQTLHNTSGIVHGDVHLSNVMLKSISNTNGTVDLRLIDYGRSFQNSARIIQKIRSFGWSAHPLLSQWELEGFDSAPRDDVARAVHGIAQLMQPWAFLQWEDMLAITGAPNMLHHKRSTNYFASTFIEGMNGFVYSPVSILPIPEENKTEIKTLLKEILILVRGMSDVNAVPPYAEILLRLRDARRSYLEGIAAAATPPSGGGH